MLGTHFTGRFHSGFTNEIGVSESQTELGLKGHCPFKALLRRRSLLDCVIFLNAKTTCIC